MGAIITKFNIRVYGILVLNKQLLLTEEMIRGKHVTKFPGGGLEFGEGLRDGLKREIREELGIEVYVNEHFYTTDFFVPSAFDDSQVISVYYFISPDDPIADIRAVEEPKRNIEKLRWVSLEEIHEDLLTLVIDKHVAQLLKKHFEPR